MPNTPPGQRVRELRAERKWSLQRLADEVQKAAPSQKAPTAGTMQKLEAGEMQMTVRWMARLARAFGIAERDLLGTTESVPAGELREDAVPYQPRPGEPVPVATNLANPGFFLVRTAVLNELGINPGDVIVADLSETAVAAVAHGDIVICQHYDDEKMLVAQTLIREFIEPSLLVTNSTTANEKSLNLKTDNVAIKAVAGGMYRPIRRRPAHSGR